jgi:hypothetical protein
MTHSGWNFLLQQFCFINIENLMSTVTLRLISQTIWQGVLRQHLSLYFVQISKLNVCNLLLLLNISHQP